MEKISKLYKFRSVDTYSLSALANSQLWFSDIGSFNDPFEGTFVFEESISDTSYKLWESIVKWKGNEEIDPAERDRKLKKLNLEHFDISNPSFLSKLAKSEFDIVLKLIQLSKVISLSESNGEVDPITENLMWSHYADGLRGFCLIFNSDELKIDIHKTSNRVIRPVKVSYQNTPNVIDINAFIQSPAMLGVSELNYIDYVVGTISSKSESWRYENEFRILSMSESNLHSYSATSLREIVIGDKMPKDQQKLVTSIAKSVNPDMTIKRAKLKKNSYLIEIVEY
ncbi:DUF2971 domain-containing protein [Aeromonas salmonicida]|uniref:DUF2971 domain-containing protein n=1 Tax=Aeromonas salmonicida TaxID=645 RepID=UPI00240E98D0|nr:DUF2971 domain-containing protein [Aeromonas salmonicida]WFC15401.1 DUF2971 domain-containing protein [Aeromonas salmonicida]